MLDADAFYLLLRYNEIMK